MTENMKTEAEKTTEEALEATAVDDGVVSLEEVKEELSPLAQAEKERDEWKDKSYRLAAEMENLKKRVRKDVEDARKYAVSNLARELISVQDNMERALTLLQEKESDKSLVEGVSMVREQLERAFSAAKIVKFTSVGEKLDPAKHQAVVEIPTDEFEAGTVAQEVQAGYMIDDRLLRPAMVGVAKKS